MASPKKVNVTLEIPPSVNHCYMNIAGSGHKGRMLTPEARRWKREAQHVAEISAIVDKWSVPDKKQKVVMEIVAYWPDHRRRDMNNLHKLLCDALEKVLYPDDCMLLVRDMDFTVDVIRPRLEVCVYKKMEETEHGKTDQTAVCVRNGSRRGRRI